MSNPAVFGVYGPIALDTSDPTAGFAMVGPSEEGEAPPDANTAIDAYHWLVAWAVILIILYFLNRTRLGHVIIYYFLALMLFFLVVTQYRFFAAALAPFNRLDKAAGTGDGSGSPAGGVAPGDAVTQNAPSAPLGQRIRDAFKRAFGRS